MANFSERLKALRTVIHMSQEELARRLGVTRSCIGNYEQGKRSPSVEDLEKIADFFNVDMDYLIGISDKQKSLNTEFLTNSEYVLIETYRRDPKVKDIIDKMLNYMQNK